jgi:hypothetical protein
MTHEHDHHISDEQVRQMIETPIGKRLMAEVEAFEHTIFHEAQKEARRLPPGPRAFDYILDMAIRSTYSSALHVGLRIAITDIAQGRKLDEWLSTHMLDGDPAALNSLEEQVASYREVLK